MDYKKNTVTWFGNYKKVICLVVLMKYCSLRVKAFSTKYYGTQVCSEHNKVKIIHHKKRGKKEF